MKLFYGWAIVAVSFLAFFAGSISSHGFGLLIKPMSEDLGWSRSSIVAGNTTATVVTALASPLVGYLVDRWGTRAVMVVSSIVTGLSLIACGGVTAPWQFYLAFGVVGGAMRPGASGLAAPTAVANWFVRRRGRAMAITTAGLSLGGFILQPFTQFLLTVAGWRSAWAILGIISIVVLTVPAAILLRRRPEDLGLRPDGDPPVSQAPATPGAPSPAPQEPDWATRDVLRTRTYWLLIAVFFLSGLGGSGLTILMGSSFADKGLTGGDLAIVVASFSFVAFFIKFVWGWLTERFSMRTYMVIYLLLNLAVFSYHNIATGFWGCLLSAMLLGSAMGAAPMLQGQVWPDLFGRRSAGAIRGMGAPFQAASGALGPIAGATVFDLTGSYAWAVWLYVAGYALAALLVTQLRPLASAGPRSLQAAQA